VPAPRLQPGVAWSRAKPRNNGRGAIGRLRNGHVTMIVTIGFSGRGNHPRFSGVPLDEAR